MKHSEIKASAGRVVRLYSDAWSGPRPGVVLDSDGPEGQQYVDVNIALHGVKDEPLLAAVRAAPSGNTLVRVPLFDCLDGGRRSDALGTGVSTHGWRVIAEWPPASGTPARSAVADAPLHAEVVDFNFGEDELKDIVAELREIRKVQERIAHSAEESVRLSGEMNEIYARSLDAYRAGATPTPGPVGIEEPTTKDEASPAG